MSTFELCETVRPLLSAVVDGEATPTETALAEEHIRECRACASHLGFLRLSHGVLSRTPDAFPPTALSARIAAATYAKPSFTERLFSFLRPAPARYALATALTVGIVAVVVSRLPHPVTAPPSVAKLPDPGLPAGGRTGIKPEIADGSNPRVAATTVSPQAHGKVAASAKRNQSVDRVAAAAMATPPPAGAPHSIDVRASSSGRPAPVGPGMAKSSTAAGEARTRIARAAEGTPRVLPAPPRLKSERHVITPAPSVIAYQPKVTAPDMAGSSAAPPSAEVTAATPRMSSAPAPRLSPTPPVSSPTTSAIVAANPTTAASGSPTASRAPVGEVKQPVVVANLPEEDEGSVKVALKNIGPRSLSGEVAMSPRGGGRRGSGMNSSFGVADGRGAGMPIVDAPGKL